MPSSYTLGSHYEDFVQSQLESGQYSSASEVLRAGLRLLEERNDRLRSLDHALAQDGVILATIQRKERLTQTWVGVMLRNF